MTASSLASLVWLRAQGIYILLHIVGILLVLFAEAFVPGGVSGDALGFSLLLSLFSCGFAIVFGIPSALILVIVAARFSNRAAAEEKLLRFFYGLGVGSTILALVLGFGFAMAEFGNMGGFIGLFSVAAIASMLWSVHTLRRRIGALQARLRGEDEFFYPGTESATEETTTIFH